MANRDYRTQAPAPLPSWMLTFDPHEQSYGPLSPGYRPGGYAEMDQYTNGGVPPSGSLGEQIQNNFQGMTSLDPQGYAVSGHDPTGADRVNRALQGLLRGYDTGNTAGNIGLQAGASFVPGGQIANSAAGAIQGATSDDKVFGRVLPTGGNSAPGYGAPDVMPRGIYGGGLLDPNASGGGGTRDSLNYAIGGTPQPGVSNPLQSPTSGAASQPDVVRPATGFTGGSGAMVDPYALPDEQSLLDLLANTQRYTGYDASTGRMGAAGAATGAGGYTYGGFDFAQDPGNRDIGKSAKYAFSQFAEDAARAGAPMPRTKAEAESWFNQYIAPKLAQAGYEVAWVQGDKARIKTREGWDEIDFLGNADGENPLLTWQSEVLAPGGGMSAGAGGGMTGSLPTSGMDLGSSALFEALLQQARDIASGKSQGASVLDTNALLTLLGR